MQVPLCPAQAFMRLMRNLGSGCIDTRAASSFALSTPIAHGHARTGVLVPPRVYNIYIRSHL
jgi:hypothetical protein